MCSVKFKDKDEYLDIFAKKKDKIARHYEWRTIFLSRTKAEEWLQKHNFNINNFTFVNEEV